MRERERERETQRASERDRESYNDRACERENYLNFCITFVYAIWHIFHSIGPQSTWE